MQVYFTVFFQGLSPGTDKYWERPKAEMHRETQDGGNIWRVRQQTRISRGRIQTRNGEGSMQARIGRGKEQTSIGRGMVKTRNKSGGM